MAWITIFQGCTLMWIRKHTHYDMVVQFITIDLPTVIVVMYARSHWNGLPDNFCIISPTFTCGCMIFSAKTWWQALPCQQILVGTIHIEKKHNRIPAIYRWCSYLRLISPGLNIYTITPLCKTILMTQTRCSKSASRLRLTVRRWWCFLSQRYAPTNSYSCPFSIDFISIVGILFAIPMLSS